MNIKLISLAEIRPGAVLGEDLADAAGTVLLPRGSVISESLLSSLQRRGIEALPLELPDPADDMQRAARRAVIEQDLRTRFGHAGNGEATRLLQRAALEYLLEKHACSL